jgi:hypothetical protein
VSASGNKNYTVNCTNGDIYDPNGTLVPTGCGWTIESSTGNVLDKTNKIVGSIPNACSGYGFVGGVWKKLLASDLCPPATLPGTYTVDCINGNILNPSGAIVPKGCGYSVGVTGAITDPNKTIIGQIPTSCHNWFFDTKGNWVDGNLYDRNGNRIGGGPGYNSARLGTGLGLGLGLDSDDYTSGWSWDWLTGSSTGTPVTATTSLSNLTVSDLATLFKKSTNQKSSMSSNAATVAAADSCAVQNSNSMFYNSIRPSLMQDIKDSVSAELKASQYQSLGPLNSGSDDCSAATAQGNEYKTTLENNADYIRKDSIPCYGCSP